MIPNELSEAEIQVLVMLGKTWDCFLELKSLHPTSQQEFMFAIHNAQNIILARPMLRWMDVNDTVERKFNHDNHNTTGGTSRDET